MHTTASELWEAWIQHGLLRPQDYDADLAAAIGRQLGSAESADLASAMTEADWRPRDLLHAIAPELESFSGMLQDLLRFYERVGARSATGENLRVSYEFDEDDALDLLLSSFRGEATAAERTVRQVSVGLSFGPDHPWNNPARSFGSLERAERILDARDLDAWPFAKGIPRPSPTHDERADDVIARGLAIVNAALSVLSRLGATRAESSEWLWEHPEAEGTLEGRIAHATHDYWPMVTAASLHGVADAVRERTVRPGLIDELDAWLARFGSDDTAQVLVDDVTELLSLPTWGKRHELYSAWITTQIDEALAPDRAEFLVDDGVLRFPFKSTHLAEVAVAGGLHELWSEVRTDLVDPVSGERLRGIQPDYRVVRRDANGGHGTTVLAVEVKQYLRSASRRHGKVLATYAAGLPEAAVLIVAHGPLGRTVRARIPAADRSRTGVFEHVRPGRPEEAEAFRAEVARLLPPPRVPQRVELRWDPGVRDLDLHVRGASGETTDWRKTSTADGELQGDAYDGGPEVLDLSPDANPPLEVNVHLYSEDTSMVAEAKPEVTITFADGTTQRLHLLPPTADPRWWRVCIIERYRLVVSSETAGMSPHSR